MSGVDVLAVIRRHAESHRALADTDAYSAQEAPKLEATCAAVTELIDALGPIEGLFTLRESGVIGSDEIVFLSGKSVNRMRAALSRVRGSA